MPSRRAARRVAATFLCGLASYGCSNSDSASTTVATTLAPLVTTTLPPSTTTSTSTTTTTAPTTTTTTLPPTTTPTSTTTTSTTTTTTLPPTTTTTIVTEGATILVANATTIQGAAGRMSDLLRGWGFTVGEPTNSAGNEERRATTGIYFLPEGEAVARSLAIALSGDIPVLPMPIPAPIFGATAALGDATVVLMLGADRAGGV